MYFFTFSFLIILIFMTFKWVFKFFWNWTKSNVYRIQGHSYKHTSDKYSTEERKIFHINLEFLYFFFIIVYFFFCLCYNFISTTLKIIWGRSKIFFAWIVWKFLFLFLWFLIMFVYYKFFVLFILKKNLMYLFHF